MDEPTFGRRSTQNPARKQRLIAGTSSAPLAIVVCYAVNKVFDIPPEDQTLNIAINTLVGSAVTVLTLCFWDLRAILLERFGRKRASDRKRRP